MNVSDKFRSEARLYDKHCSFCLLQTPLNSSGDFKLIAQRHKYYLWTNESHHETNISLIQDSISRIPKCQRVVANKQTYFFIHTWLRGIDCNLDRDSRKFVNYRFFRQCFSQKM